MNDERLLNDVLRLALRYPNLLIRDAFEQLAHVLMGAVPFLQMGVFVPDGPHHQRVYAISSGPIGDVLPFGARVPRENTHLMRDVFEQGVPYLCEDTSQGTPLERSTASQGVGSYWSIPVWGESCVVADLAIGFKDAEMARRAPVALLGAVANILGENLERMRVQGRERRLAMILETSGDAMLAWDREGRITDANVAALLLTGFARDELVGRPVASVLTSPDQDGAGSTPFPSRGLRMQLVPKPGSPKSLRGPLVVDATITGVEDDPLVAVHALLRDLSLVAEAERRAAERLLRIRELEEQHRTLLDNAPLIIFRLDPVTMELVYLNRHAERLLGVPTGEALKTPGFLRNAHAEPVGRKAFEEAAERAKEGHKPLPYEARLSRRPNGEMMARGTVFPLFSEQGEVTAIEGLLADVSAEQSVRTRLVQADRLSTLGMLAAGVAHEINNPAAFLLLSIDMLGRMLQGPGVSMEPHVAENAASMLWELRDSVQRIVHIARDLRAFASSSPADSGQLSIVDVNATVESALTLTRGQLIERARIERDLGDAAPVLMGTGRLGQVLVNLLVNAAQAISKEDVFDHVIRVSTKSVGETVQIEVSDTGIGIDQDVMPRIWTPFFTTKNPDVGTGLGLPISREIIEGAGGRIWAESPVQAGDERRGTRFVIELPAAGAAPLPRLSSVPPSMNAKRRAKVLVIEDEPALSRVLAEEIGEQHEVVTAGNAFAALKYLKESYFDAVLCDLRMPGMSGEGLYERVVEMDRDQAERFIFMTGVGFGAGIERFLSETGRPVLEKPFAREAVLRAIEKVLR